jgi:hypothetical protein
MARNSEQAIRIPRTLSGDRALERFSIDVRLALEALRDRGRENQARQSFTSPYCPLTPHFLREESSQWKVRWRPGYVYELYPDTSGTGPVTEYEIFIGATALSASTAPDLEIDLGDFIYLHWETDPQGAIQELSAGISAEIVALGSEQDSTFAVLPDGTGSGGTDGSYYLLLGEVETVAGLASISKAGWRGNFWWKAGWNALENVGTGEKIYKEYDISGDNKQLRSLVERASDPQILLSQNGDDEIRIEGNGNDCTITFKAGYTTRGTLIFKDGLLVDPDQDTDISVLDT